MNSDPYEVQEPLPLYEQNVVAQSPPLYSLGDSIRGAIYTGRAPAIRLLPDQLVPDANFFCDTRGTNSSAHVADYTPKWQECTEESGMMTSQLNALAKEILACSGQLFSEPLRIALHNHPQQFELQLSEQWKDMPDKLAAFQRLVYLQRIFVGLAKDNHDEKPDLRLCFRSSIPGPNLPRLLWCGLQSKLRLRGREFERRLVSSKLLLLDYDHYHAQECAERLWQ